VRNDLGLLTRITGLNAEQWHFGYSPMGRLQFVADPLNRTNRFGYDNRGRQNTATFGDGTTLTNTLDAAGNLVREQFSAGPDLVYAYDKVNRLTNAADVALAYDADGRLTNALSAGVNYGATYDAGGRLASVRYHNGAFTVTYTYNSQNQLIGVNDSLTSTFLQFFYDQAGRLINITRPNAVNSTYTYDAAGRLTRIQDGTIIDVQYTLDAAGQVAMAGFNAPLDPAALLTNTHSAPVTYDAAHQINSAGFNYDARGRLIASPGKTFTWDGASRLTGIGAVALGYNGLNELATRTEGGATTRYFYNHAIALAPIMAERNETTMQVERYYVWSPGGRLLYLIDAANGNAVCHVHTDQVGSVLALTSAAGVVTDA
jgi:YD repeat-containing protein